jgi:hypothetical protein
MSRVQSPRSTPEEAQTGNLSALAPAQFQSGCLPWPGEGTEIPSRPDSDTGDVESYMDGSGWRSRAGADGRATRKTGFDPACDAVIAWRILREEKEVVGSG